MPLDQNKGSLTYVCPGHGSRNLAHLALVMPESSMLFACPAACTRIIALSTAKLGMKDRFYALTLSEEDIIRGNIEEQIIDGIDELFSSIDKKPRVLMIFVSCIDGFLNTDHEYFLSVLGKKYPDVKFLVGFMNPICIESEPPIINIQKKLVSLLEKTDKRRKAVNFIGCFAKPDDKCELVMHLKNNGYEVRHISDCKSFEDYEKMAESLLNIVITPTGVPAAQYLKDKLGTDYCFIPYSVKFDEIDNGIKKVCEMLSIKLPDLDKLRKETIEAIKRASFAAKGIELTLDYNFSFTPFALTRLLREYGFKIKTIYTDSVSEAEKLDFAYLNSKGGINIAVPTSPKTPKMLKDKRNLIALGNDCAYLEDSRYPIVRAADCGFYGYYGLKRLSLDILKALDKKDLNINKDLNSNKNLNSNKDAAASLY